jgi:hypothetical protein
MKKPFLLLVLVVTFTGFVYAQDEEGEWKEGGFKAENIFTGGSLSLSFGSDMFLIGANPVLGYKLADWVDAGIVINYQYTSYRNYYFLDDKMRQSLYGGGAFLRLYPINFLFATVQPEHNFIRLKYLPANGGSAETYTTSANSLLVGAGYASGRFPGDNSSFFYLSVMWDLSSDIHSPYKNNVNNAIPIIRGGVNVYPFRKRY